MFLRSAVRRSPRPVLTPPLELGAQPGSLQPGPQLHPAAAILLHLQAQLPFAPHRPRPRTQSVGAPPSEAERVGGAEAPASKPPHPHHPPAGLGLRAGARPRPQTGHRQPVHVALIPHTIRESERKPDGNRPMNSRGQNRRTHPLTLNHLQCPQ